MGTKSNPGRFDCYDKAALDEPMFVLLARDPLAAHLVSMWSKMRYGDLRAARAVFEDMLAKHGKRYAVQPDPIKAEEAMDCSFEMFHWRSKNKGF